VSAVLACWLAPVLLAGLASCLPGNVQAQSPASADQQIVFASELEAQTRRQLRDVLAEYDVEPWIFERAVRIDATSPGSSEPIITLSTRHRGDDLGLLAEFVHEQIHVFVKGPSLRAALDTLRTMYPNAPTALPRGGPSATATYLHLVVNWLELDAMAELVGEATARRRADAEEHYTWINDRVQNDTQTLGRLLADHDLLITPESGIVVEP
jgi:hypothetical protein